MYWPMLFQQVVYWAWSARNEVTHQGVLRKVRVRPETLLQQSLIAQELHSDCNLVGGRQMKFINWKKPALGWVKRNVDGAATRNPRESSVEGLTRNDQGCWLKGFSANLGSSSNVAAEL